MKKLLYLFTSILLFSCSSDDSKDDSSDEGSNPNQSELSKYIVECSGFVKFDSNDKSFLNFLISKGYDLDNDSKISCDEASKIVDLDLGDSGYVSNLLGVESLKNIKTLSGYVNLNSNTELNLYNNSNLKSITLVQSKARLSNGVLVSSRSSIPTFILPKNSSLEVFDCPSVHINHILNLSDQSKIKIIDVSNSNLTDELDLSGCHVLETLNAINNSLKIITFSDKENPHFKSLSLSSTDRNNNYNYISSIKLGTFPNLEELGLAYNNLVSVDISKNKNLKILDLSFNKIIKVDLSQNKEIMQLKLRSLPISVLNISELANLRVFYCTNTLIEDIDLSYCKFITNIQIDDNQLKTLNLKNGRNSFINSMSATKNKISCITIDNGFVPDPKKWLKDSNTKYCN